MAEVTAAMVKELRQKTGAGMMDCKAALAEAGGDLEQAVRILKEKGLDAAVRKEGRKAAEGVVEAYIHAGSRLGVLVEVNCETDFVARTPEFKELAHTLAMQVAAASPLYVSREDVPPEVLEEKKALLRAQAERQGKPPQVVEKIVAGRLEKFYSEACLLDQPYIRDPDMTVSQLLKEAVARLGENILVRRFARLELGRETTSGGMPGPE